MDVCCLGSINVWAAPCFQNQVARYWIASVKAAAKQEAAVPSLSILNCGEGFVLRLFFFCCFFLFLFLDEGQWRVWRQNRLDHCWTEEAQIWKIFSYFKASVLEFVCPSCTPVDWESSQKTDSTMTHMALEEREVNYLRWYIYLHYHEKKIVQPLDRILLLSMSCLLFFFFSCAWSWQYCAEFA